MPERNATILGRLVRLPAGTLLVLIRVYQRFLSPALRVVGGPMNGCRFAPTCSHYAAESVATHGALAGIWLATRRILKCSPLHPGGFDPVPARRAPVCVCVRQDSVNRHPSPIA